jgi:hypothetical protein
MQDTLTFIKNYNVEFGKPGLLHTVKVLQKQYDNLLAHEKQLFDEFIAEVQQLAKQLDNLDN